MRITKYRTELDDNLYPVLVKEKAFNYANDITNAKEIVKLFNDGFNLSKQTEEYVYMLCTTLKGKPIGIFEISHGTINASVISPREVFMKALSCNAGQIFLIHNHPSGSCEPSKEDTNVYLRIKEAGQLMGILLTDFIIVGNEYLSYVEQGM